MKISYFSVKVVVEIMNILYLHQYFTTPEISGGTRSYSFARRLVENGHKVTIITSSSKISEKYPINNKKIKRMNIDGIDIVIINVPYSQKMGYRDRIKAFINFMCRTSIYLMKKNEYDLVFATSTPLTIAIPGLVAKYRNRIPFLFEVRDLWPEYPVEFAIIKNKILIRLLEIFCKFVYNKAEYIVAISNSMANRIIKKYCIDSKKLAVIPIGSWKYLRKGLDNNLVEKYIDKYNLKNKFIIGYAGTLGHSNNIDSILRMAESLRIYEDIVFVVAGDGKEKKRIENEIKEKNLKNVKLIGRFKQIEIINIIQMFDLCYLSGIECNSKGKKLMNAEDALPNKFFDYILMGKPLLINTKGEITDLMKQYNFGFYINDKDERNVKDIVFKLKNDNKLRESLGENALKVAEIYDREKMVLKLEKVFKEAVM